MKFGSFGRKKIEQYLTNFSENLIEWMVHKYYDFIKIQKEWNEGRLQF